MPMSKTIQSFAASELTHIRITCNRCKGAIEVAVDKFTTQVELRCPVCPDVIYSSGMNKPATDPYLQLMHALRKLATQEHATVEFPVEQK